MSAEQNSLFLFVALLSLVLTQVFSSPQDILKGGKKEPSLKTTFGVMYVFEYYKVP